jgi:hypothetical protein
MVNHSDFPWLELTGVYDPVHYMDIMFALWGVEEQSINVNFAVNAAQEGAKRQNPLSFEVREQCCHVFENGPAHACQHKLIPGERYAEHGACFAFRPRELEKILDLACTLFD